MESFPFALVAVKNRAGANRAVASELLARAAPEGHTIKVNTAGDTIKSSLTMFRFVFGRRIAARNRTFF